MDTEWRVIVFKEQWIRTDYLLYGDGAYLLLPSDGEENRFLARSDENGVDFYIGSTSRRNLDTCGRFFSRMYGSFTEPETPETLEDASFSLCITNSISNRKRDFSYFPGFLNNVVFLPSSLPDITIQYEAIIRSSTGIRGNRSYNFCLRLNGTAENNGAGDVIGYLRNEILRLRNESGWRMRIKRGRNTGFSDHLLKKPLAMANFVRIPDDEGLLR